MSAKAADTLDPFAAEIAKAVWALSPLKPELFRQPSAVAAPDDEKAVSDDESAVFDIPGFCKWAKLSRSTFYEMQRAGTAPKSFKAGTAVRISRRAAREWLLEREAAARTEAA